MSILGMDLAGSVLILAILTVRAFALFRLPRQTFVWLWLLAAVRLLLPLALPSPLSIYSLFQLQGISPLPPAASAGAAAPELAQAALPAPATSAAGPAAADPVAAADVLPGIWLAGVLVCAAVFAILYFRWLRRFAASLPVDGENIRTFLAAHPLRRPLAVRQSDCITAPLTYGIFRPVILLPKSAAKLDAASLTCVLEHEYTHIRRLDALSKLFFVAAVCLHWFNPLVWVMFSLANRDLELGCDEAVLHRSSDRAGYARTLIQMEEQKRLLVPFCSSCSRNVLDERIRSIMKFKKYTVPTVILAAVLIVCMGTALATSPPAPQPEATKVYEEVIARLEEDGATSYSFDGGRTFTVLSDAQLAEQYGIPEVEWWTAEEYEAWLQNEKAALQEMLGSRVWTSSDGEFIWTQEKIDETIAMYEETLAQIRSGMLISKSVDGSDGIVLAQYSTDVDTFSEEPVSLEEYAPYGLVADARGYLSYRGQRVGYFEDRVEIGPGMNASKHTFYDPEGTVHIRTVRQATQNADGSTDPFGKLLGLGLIPDADAEQRIAEHLITEMQQTSVVAEDEIQMQETRASEGQATDDLLAPYAEFGLSWESEPEDLRMYWQGKPVHCLFDETTGTWVANNLHGTDLDPAALHLEAVYAASRLTGLRESAEVHPPEPETAVVFSGSGASGAEQQGTTFEEVFGRYAPLGLSYEAVEKAGARSYNLFYGGQRVNHFADVSSKGTFTFDSADQVSHGLTARVVYKDGKAAGIEAK